MLGVGDIAKKTIWMVALLELTDAHECTCLTSKAS